MPRKVVALADPACAGPSRHHVIGQKARANTVGVDCIGAHALRAVLHRILPHQRQGGGIGQTIGAEVRTWIDRLLGDVEQEHPTARLAPEDAHRRLGGALVSEEVELKAGAHHRVVDLADGPGEGRAGI